MGGSVRRRKKNDEMTKLSRTNVMWRRESGAHSADEPSNELWKTAESSTEKSRSLGKIEFIYENRRFFFSSSVLPWSDYECAMCVCVWVRFFKPLVFISRDCSIICWRHINANSLSTIVNGFNSISTRIHAESLFIIITYPWSLRKMLARCHRMRYRGKLGRGLGPWGVCAGSEIFMTTHSNTYCEHKSERGEFVCWQCRLVPYDSL